MAAILQMSFLTWLFPYDLFFLYISIHISLTFAPNGAISIEPAIIWSNGSQV